MISPQYAIVAFPVFDCADSVEAVRRKFDPQAGLLAAHVTLVFPFSDDLGEASLAEHVGRAVEGVPAFPIALTDLSTKVGGYLFLNVGAGSARFHSLHARLYSGPLARHRSSAEYRPHVTVGRLVGGDGLFDAEQETVLALTLPILGTVADLAIFRLDGPGRGAVVCRVPLGSEDARLARGA